MALSDYLSTKVATGPSHQSLSKDYSSQYAQVVSVITNINQIDTKLDIVNKIYGEADVNVDYVDKNTLLYGAITFRLSTQQTISNASLKHAYPINRNFFTLPVVGEIVEITQIDENTYVYKPVHFTNLPSYNTNINLLYSTANLSEKSKASSTSGLSTLKEAKESGIPNTKANTNNPDSKLGGYYKRNIRIHSLKPNEGDTIIQSKFGSSIRFSGYLDDNKSLQSPAVLIRNGENADSQKNNKIYDVTTEDINKDGTSIQITSGKYKTLFSETIKVSKQANQNYPSSDQLIGDQIVVNSGRLILSSKTAETFLFSKKTFSIFTDDLVTIDTEKGLNCISQNGNIIIGANNNKNLIFNVGSGGKIYHGTDTATQQAVLGNELVLVLTELITAINGMMFATPSGPTTPGPIDKSQFTNIQNKLKNILSKNNYLV